MHTGTPSANGLVYIFVVIERLEGIPLKISERILGEDVALRCNYFPPNISYSSVEWLWSGTFNESDRERVYYYEERMEEDNGRLQGRVSKTHMNGTISLRINQTRPSDDGMYFARYSQGVYRECNVTYISIK